MQTTSNRNASKTTVRSAKRGSAKRASPKTASRTAGRDDADVIKQRVKRTVGKGLAYVVGAVEGFGEELEENDLPASASNAIRQVGRTTRSVAETTRDQAYKLKKAIKGSRRTIARSIANRPQAAKGKRGGGRPKRSVGRSHGGKKSVKRMA